VIDPDTRGRRGGIDLARNWLPHGLSLDAGARSAVCERGGFGGSRRRSGHRRTRTRRPSGDRHRRAEPALVRRQPGRHHRLRSNKEAPFLSVVDLINGEMVDQIEIPGGEGLAVSPDGTAYTVAAPYDPSAAPHPPLPTGIRVIDTNARSVIAVLPTDNVVVPTHLTVGGKCWRAK